MKSEDKVQQQIFIWYTNNYCLKHHVPRCNIYSIPNDSSNAIEQMRKVSTGLQRGVADLEMWHGVNTYYIEIKTDKGVQSQFQKDWQIRCEDSGRVYVLIRSLEDFKIFIKKLVY